MKLNDSNLLRFRIAAVVVLISAAKYIFGEFLIPVESKGKDFIVKFKGEILSWKNLTKLLRQHNITVPDEGSVLRTKNSRDQSCQSRCFLDERRFRHKTCFCDKACSTFGDCCLDFHLSCNETGNGASFGNMICGDVNDPDNPWSGVIMKSTCSLHKHQNSNDCQTVRKLDLALERELPVFDRTQNVIYRSIACARCNNAGNLTFWGLNVSCRSSNGSFSTPVNITAVKKFLMEHPDCSWKYAPRNGKEQYKYCVLHDAPCASNSHHLPVLPVIKELCSLYSMIFSTEFRNPHCALCHPTGTSPGGPVGTEDHPSIVAPLSILLDVSRNIPDTKVQKDPPPTLITGPPLKDYNLTLQVLNCTSNTTNCTAIFRRYNCENFSVKKQSTPKRFSLNESHDVVFISPKQLLQEKSAMGLQGNSVYILCKDNQSDQGQGGKEPKWYDSEVLIYVTFTGTLLSSISLLFLLFVYTYFKELRNVPGKCLISLSVALLCYQAIFLGTSKSREVATLCKAVAIFLHYCLLAAFSWMSVMAFDTARTFTGKVTDPRRQPSDARKILIKYCIVGWGLPAVIVVLCFVLDFTGTFHFGYGNSTYCWISDKTAIAVSMVTPVSLALVFNITCLVNNLYAIRHLQQDANLMVSNSSQASLTLISIKLTTVMGLTWILGLLANWHQTSFLQYPSTVLNSMQGFFIAFCFTTTKKVRSLIKKRWNGAREANIAKNIRVPRDQCTRNTEDETAAGLNMHHMKSLSMEQAKQDSS